MGIPLKEWTDFLQAAPVLVVGDLMLDHYVHGEVHRQAPEAPVPILSATHESFLLGGAGGVVANIAGLGARAHVLGAVAADGAGEKIRAHLAACQVDTQYLTIVADRPSTVKMRLVKGDELLLRADYEKALPLVPTDEEKLISNIPAAIKGCGAVILSDYGKGVLTKAVMAAVMKAAKAQNIPVLVDPKGRDFTIYQGADFITPNAKELGEATGMPTQTQDDVIKAAAHLLTTTDIKTVIAKRSEHGMSIITAGAAPVHYAATAKEVAGVAGAGDTVIATLAVALAAGIPVQEAVQLANAAAGVIVAKPGTTPIEKAELLTVLSGEVADHTQYEAPVYKDWQQARTQIAAWEAQGLRVGFTNGCFDILHYGHVNYLNRARERCDRLVVGLNADASITRLKGAGRPVHGELSRGAVMAALGAVDMVVIFGEDKADDDKPIRVIGALKPGICFKGGDYRVEDLPEAQTVFAYGGHFEIMPLYDGHSTTSSIRKIQKTG